MAPSAADDKGRPFIDANPTRFCKVLDFLRTNTPPSSLAEDEAVTFDYFGVDLPRELRHRGARLLPDYRSVLARLRGPFAYGKNYPNPHGYENLPLKSAWEKFCRTEAGREALSAALIEDIELNYEDGLGMRHLNDDRKLIRVDIRPETFKVQVGYKQQRRVDSITLCPVFEKVE